MMMDILPIGSGSGQTDEYRKLLEVNDMKGKWNDILININSIQEKMGS